MGVGKNAHANPYPPRVLTNSRCRRGPRLRCPRSEREQPALSAYDRHSIADRDRAELAHADPRAGPFDSTRTSVPPVWPEDTEAAHDTSGSLLLAEVGFIRLRASPTRCGAASAASGVDGNPPSNSRSARTTGPQPRIGAEQNSPLQTPLRVLGLDAHRSHAAGRLRGSSRRPRLPHPLMCRIGGLRRGWRLSNAYTHSLAFARIRIRSLSHVFAIHIRPYSPSLALARIHIRSLSHEFALARIRNRAYSHWTPWCSATFQA